MMANWRRDEARRKAGEKLQRTEERRSRGPLGEEASRDFGGGWRSRNRHSRRAAARRGKSSTSCNAPSTRSLAQEQAERDERQRAYVEPFVDLEHGMPDALDVAFALSQRHAGGAAVSLADLLVEAGLADESNAAGRSKSPHVGVALAGLLRELHWRKRRMAYGVEWVPPGRKERE